MCLAIPSKVEKILPDSFAVVDTMGVKRIVSLHLIQEEVNVGDYVLVHVGYAISKISIEEAIESLDLYDQIIKELGDEKD
ncbi:MAG: HypC/HybG/HupF family hydrogenase formation chaperone [Hydrogenothermaceae bacterium]|nr:HypC/HybG/HupF family hydrogenase formation chaperone [Hydrogenothermaceae bacterium]